jgi:multisubunit Na+/H+ antiporter MnhG subunit
MTVGLASCLAYIGPGGGLALLGPLAGVILAVMGALAMIAIWPLRAVFKRVHARTRSAGSS